MVAALFTQQQWDHLIEPALTSVLRAGSPKVWHTLTLITELNPCQFPGKLGSEYRTNKVSLGKNQLPDKKIQVYLLAEQETSKSI